MCSGAGNVPAATSAAKPLAASRSTEQDAPGPVRSFAGFLRQDLNAVTAALTLQWSSGIVEGNVNRMKTIKRSMYNRASFRLLRIRILTRP